MLVDGATHPPPGASGAYVEVEVTPEHKLKSAFMPAPAATYYEAGHGPYSPYPLIESAHPHLANYSLPHEPQAFRISIDDKMKNMIDQKKVSDGRREKHFLPSNGLSNKSSIGRIPIVFLDRRALQRERIIP